MISVYYVVYSGNMFFTQYGHLQASNIKFMKSDVLKILITEFSFFT